MKKNTKKISYIKLFFEMLTISAFTFGGGFIIISMMKKRFCEELEWVEEGEVLDMVAIAQSTPGALAVNSAIIFGYRIAGLNGALISTIATIIPPIIIISIVSLIYDTFITNQFVRFALQAMRAGVAAVIIDVVFDLGKNVVYSNSYINIFLMVFAFISVFFFNISAITIIILFIILGTAKYFLTKEGIL